MPDPVANAIAADLTVEAIRLIGTKGLPAVTRRVRKWWSGKKLLVVGPRASGKTNFIHVLRFGELKPETRRRRPTYDVDSYPTLDIEYGHNNSLQVLLNSATDIPGQKNPEDQATLAIEIAPHVLVIVLNLEDPAYDSADRNKRRPWIWHFCKWYRHELKAKSGAFAAERLQCMLVLLNKRDKSSAREFGRQRKEVHAAIDRHLKVPLGELAECAPVLPSILVRKKGAEEYLDEILISIATSMHE